MTNRLLFILTSLITVTLLLGSAVLQRLVFRAEPTSATVGFSVDSFTLGSGQEMAVKIDLTVDRPVTILAGELVVNYPDQSLILTSVVAEPGWRLAKTKPETGALRLVVEAVGQAPSPVNQSTSLLTINFVARAPGLAFLEIAAAKTRLALTDPNLPSSVLELLAGGEKIIGSVANRLVQEPIVSQLPASPALKDSPPPAVDQLPRAVARQVVLGSRSAVFFFQSPSPTVSIIRYGDSRLSQSVKTATPQNDSALVIGGLQVGKRYYYRAELETTDQTKILGSLQSFQTLQAGQGPLQSDHSSLVAVGGAESRIFFFARDSQDRPVLAENVVILTENDQVKIGSISHQPDYLTATATAPTPTLTKFSARATDGTILATSEPVLVGQVRAEPTDRSTISQLLALRLVAIVAAVALLLGLLLFRLTRWR